MPINFDNAISECCPPPIYRGDRSLCDQDGAFLTFTNWINTRLSLDDGNTWVCPEVVVDGEFYTIKLNTDGPIFSVDVLAQNVCPCDCSKPIKFNVTCRGE